MKLFKDAKGKFSTKKTINVCIFLMVAITWVLGLLGAKIPEWMPNMILGAMATAAAQYTWGKRIDGGK